MLSDQEPSVKRFPGTVIVTLEWFGISFRIRKKPPSEVRKPSENAGIQAQGKVAASSEALDRACSMVPPVRSRSSWVCSKPVRPHTCASAPRTTTGDLPLGAKRAVVEMARKDLKMNAAKFATRSLRDLSLEEAKKPGSSLVE